MEDSTSKNFYKLFDYHYELDFKISFKDSISNGIYDHNISNNYNRDINYPKVYVEPCKIDFFNDKYNSVSI
jgi:hypothetical protein